MISSKKWLYVAMVLLCMSCATDSSEEEVNTEELVQVNPVANGYYTSIIPSTHSRAADSNTLKNVTIHPLENGSTIRLMVYDNNKKFIAKYSRTYLVYNSGESESTLLSPCDVDDDGKVTSVTGTPLYMTPGTYYFRILSPAKALNSKNSFVNRVDNGEYLLATDDRYTQTAMMQAEIKKVKQQNNTQTLYLPPIINQTARMQFTIKSGEGVHSLDMLTEGIEISGIQRPEENTNNINWVNGGQLPVKVGDLQGLVRITEATRNADNSLMAHTGILPTDARSQSINILLNLKVNGNPTQYQMMLNKMLIEAGHSYNYTATVKISNGVTVLTWQNRSWTENVEM